MQWDDSRGRGFSEADPSLFYLPVDPDGQAPNVAEQEQREDSLLATVKELLKVRREQPAFSDHQNLEIVYAQEGERAFAYRRGNLLLLCNPSGMNTILCNFRELASAKEEDTPEKLFEIGHGSFARDELLLAPQSFVIYKF